MWWILPLRVLDGTAMWLRPHPPGQRRRWTDRRTGRQIPLSLHI